MRVVRSIQDHYRSEIRRWTLLTVFQLGSHDGNKRLRVTEVLQF